LNQTQAEIWDTKRPWRKGALVKQGSVEGEQTGAREMASGARLFVLNQKVVELATGSHRRNAGDELLRWRTEVNDGGATQKGTETKERSRRKRRLP
jgi:hypothetical protein